MHLFFCDTRIKSEGTNHQHFLWKNDDYSKTEKENKNRRHGFRGKLSDNKLAKFQLNRFRGCRLGVENVRLTFRNFRSEKTRKIYLVQDDQSYGRTSWRSGNRKHWNMVKAPWPRYTSRWKTAGVDRTNQWLVSFVIETLNLRKIYELVSTWMFQWKLSVARN